MKTWTTDPHMHSKAGQSSHALLSLLPLHTYLL